MIYSIAFFVWMIARVAPPGICSVNIVKSEMNGGLLKEMLSLMKWAIISWSIAICVMLVTARDLVGI
jgi:hypothetical protein